jgi:hypothetical protein
VAVAFNKELNERQLRWTLLLFFLALAIPASLLIGRAYSSNGKCFISIVQRRNN